MLGQRARTLGIVVIVLAAVFGGLGYTLLHGRSAGRSTGHGTSDAAQDLTLPPQTVQPVGQVIGEAPNAPSALHAKFDVAVPTKLTPDSAFPGDWNLVVYPADVKTIAGQGTVSASAPFAHMGGVATVKDHAYVATDSTISSVNLKTGTVDVLAGSATQQGCSDAADPSAVRFQGPPGDVVTDGRNLFVANGCGVSEVAISTGATTLLTAQAGALTFGPDGHLYAGSYRDGNASIVQIDPSSGDAKPYVIFPAGSFVMGMAADSQALWASVDEGPSAPAVIDRVSFADGTITRYALKGVDVVGFGQLASAGIYLDAPSVSGHGVLQFDKTNGSWGQAVGGDAGDVDGVWASGTFGSVRGVASDGGELWVTDATNHQLRLVEFNARAGMEMGAG